MKGQPWTALDDELLRWLYPKYSKAEVAERMMRSVFSVKSRAAKLGLIQPPRLWTAVDQATFKRLYPHTDNTVLATLFNRTIKAIHQQAKFLGVQKTREYLSDYSRRLNAEREAQGRTPGAPSAQRKYGTAIYTAKSAKTALPNTAAGPCMCSSGKTPTAPSHQDMPSSSRTRPTKPPTSRSSGLNASAAPN